MGYIPVVNFKSTIAKTLKSFDGFIYVNGRYMFRPPPDIYWLWHFLVNCLEETIKPLPNCCLQCTQCYAFIEDTFIMQSCVSNVSRLEFVSFLNLNRMVAVGKVGPLRVSPMAT